MKIHHARRAVTMLALIAAGRLEAQEARDTARGIVPRTVGIEYGYANFEGAIDPWHLASVWVGRGRGTGTVIGRATVADRFGSTGSQFEVDAYPRLTRSTYGYFNLGYSASSIFPDWRIGAEVYRSLPRGYEVSVGARQLRFGGPPVTLFTGSVGRYVGNYWFAARPYVRDSDGLSGSASLTARRYFIDSDNYIGGLVGYGSTPTDRVTQLELSRTSSVRAAVNGSRSLTARTLGAWTLGYEREEITASQTRNRWELLGGLQFRF